MEKLKNKRLEKKIKDAFVYCANENRRKRLEVKIRQTKEILKNCEEFGKLIDFNVANKEEVY